MSDLITFKPREAWLVYSNTGAAVGFFIAGPALPGPQMRNSALIPPSELPPKFQTREIVPPGFSEIVSPVLREIVSPVLGEIVPPGSQ